jgi:uncharacterized membrane protein
MTYFTVTEFPAFTPGISRYGSINDELKIINLPAGTKSIRLISEGVLDFDMTIYSAPYPPVGMIDVIGTSQTTGGSKYVRTLSAVERLYDLALECEDVIDTIAEGTTTTYTIKVWNMGNGNDTFDLTVDQIWNATLSENNVYLGRDETTEVVLTVTAPQGSGGQVAEINVTGTSQGNTSRKSILTAITYSEVPSFNFNMTHRSPDENVHPGMFITHNLTSSNQGNVQDTYDLEIFDLPENWDYIFDINPVTVDSNEALVL